VLVLREGNLKGTNKKGKENKKKKGWGSSKTVWLSTPAKNDRGIGETCVTNPVVWVVKCWMGGKFFGGKEYERWGNGRKVSCR